MDRFPGASFIKIFLIIIIISIGPSLIVISRIGVENVKKISREIENEAFRQLDFTSYVQETINASTYQTLSTLAVLLAIEDTKPLSKQYLLKEVLWRNPEYMNIYLIDKTGKIIYSGYEDSRTTLSDYSFIKSALDGNGFTAGIFYAEINSAPRLAYAITLRNSKGEPTGCVSVIYSLSSYEKLSDKLNETKRFRFILTDNNGVRIFCSSNEEAEKTRTMIDLKTLEAIEAGPDTGKLEMKSTEKARIVYKKIRLTDTQSPYLFMLLETSESELVTPIKQSILKSVLLLILTAIGSLFISSILGYLLIGKSLAKLIYSLKSIQSGDFSTRIDPENMPKEIKEVSFAINDMTGTLEKRNRERDIYEKELNSALYEKDTLLKEIHHRVKNNLQMILSLINIEKGNYSDIGLFSRQLESRINAMSSIYESLFLSESLARIEVNLLIKSIFSYIMEMYPYIKSNISYPHLNINLELATSLSLILNELIINSAQHGRSADGSCELYLKIESMNKKITVTIKDNGPGFPPALDIDSTESFGLLLVKNLVNQIGGEITIQNHSGSVVIITFFNNSKEEHYE